ncbi:hypothetical protein BDZ88DRAFT_9231 [Geranomyces variabilis]|nr:hypothetical protein BDZ88DRAFT_9231 [Geranomyces variabilis]KAJ3142980.1 hypothetical protein HDU90_002854 [Geranomyces variabilis]
MRTLGGRNSGGVSFAARCPAQAASLSSFPTVKDALVGFLKADRPWRKWDDQLHQILLAENASNSDEDLWRAIRLRLVNCHAALCPNAGVIDHERTSWIDKVIPWFSALRMTGLVEWRWCEHSARKVDGQARKGDYPRGKKSVDGVGMAPRRLQNAFGVVSREEVAQILGDSVKLLENSVLALRHMLASYKDAQWSIMEPLSVLSVQFIRGKMTPMLT